MQTSSVFVATFEDWMQRNILLRATDLQDATQQARALIQEHSTRLVSVEPASAEETELLEILESDPDAAEYEGLYSQ